MKFKDFLLGFIGLIIIGILVMYYFVPMEQITFGTSTNPEFNLENKSKNMQFYLDMRFPYTDISYNISEECPLSKTLEMKEAFEIIENVTDLKFYMKEKDPQINVYCEEKNRIEEGLFIAGEGGPTRIIELDQYSLIQKGEILLIRNSRCERPNIAIHELLHVLGFDHSENSNNIMYEVSRCKQTIGEEIPAEINRIYEEAPLPDLKLGEIELQQRGRYLDFNVSISNQGLINSSRSKLNVYGDDKLIEEFEINALEPGSGMKLKTKNIWINQLRIENIKIKIESSEPELSKNNNEIVLEKL
jgi:hypothetical protein